MSIIEIRGGPITHRYLMNKSKNDIARMYLDHLRVANNHIGNLLHFIDGEEAPVVVAHARAYMED